MFGLFKTKPKPEGKDKFGNSYATVTELVAGDLVSVDDLIEKTTLLKRFTKYTVAEDTYGLYIHEYGKELKFYLDGQLSVCPVTGLEYYIGIYKD